MKRKDILADFTSSLAKKDPVAVNLPAPSGPEGVSPVPAEVTPVLPQKRASKLASAHPPAIEGSGELGFQRITVSLTAADLKLADDKRFDIGQKHRALLDRSKLLKVALRALDPDHPQLPQWIAEVVDSDLRKTKVRRS